MDRETVTLDEIKSTDYQSGGYSITINSHTYERLERHILILKKLIDRSATKQRWIIDAINEKLTSDADNLDIPKENSLSVKINDDLDKKLLKRIDFIKKFRSSYSKKKWILDAVLEKLDRDEKAVEQKLLEMKQSQTDTYKNQVDLLKTELEKLKAQLLKNLP